MARHCATCTLTRCTLPMHGVFPASQLTPPLYPGARHSSLWRAGGAWEFVACESNQRNNLEFVYRQGQKIRQVLNGLVIGKSGGEWDTQCAGNFSQTERTIRMGKSVSNGFADLIVTSTTVNRESRMIKGECNDINQKPKIARFTLRYDGNAYVVPRHCGNCSSCG